MASDEPLSPGSDRIEWARARMAEYITTQAQWRTDAADAFALVAGDQWDDEVRGELEDQGRPVFTFNRVAGFIRGICGLETQSRNQVRYYARELNDSGVSDVINAAVAWVRSNCDAEDEESDAFKDMLTCGVGWTETLFTTEEDPEGQIVIERVDPLHMRWDASARKRGLTDTRWRARIKYLPISTIEDVWGPAKADEVRTMLETDSEILDEFASQPGIAGEGEDYDGNDSGQARRKNGYPVTQFQYVVTTTYYAVPNPMTGEVEQLPAEEYRKLAERMGGELAGTRFKKRQYRQLIYCGTVELEDQPLPCDGFTFQPITGVRDRNNGVWYGFVRDMVDPQRWINKFFSSMADVVASQAKGGLLAEVDAFVDKDQAQEEWADPRSIVWMRSGAMAAGKVKERASSGIPAGFSQLLEFTVGSLPHVAGVNLEFLGLAGREQAGVLESQRKQAAVATLAEFFNALRLYRKQQGRILLQFINEFISDGRLIRVVGKRDEQFVPLVKQPGTLKYDIVVDEAPNSPDQKQRTWEALMQIIPTAAKMGFPIPPSIVEYAPFPAALVKEWQQFAQGEAGLPPEMKEKIQQMQEQLAALQEENKKLLSKREEKIAELQLKQVEGQQDLELERQRFIAEMQLKREEMMLQLQLEREKMLGQLQMQQEQAKSQMQLERAKTAAQFDLQEEAAMRQDAIALMSAEGGEEGEGGKGITSKVGGLTKALSEAQAETREAINALAAVMQQLAQAQMAPRRVSDGKGREFIVKVGD